MFQGSPSRSDSSQIGQNTHQLLVLGRFELVPAVALLPTASACLRNNVSIGCRFKAKKGAGGDTKGSSKVEPYAYWPMDRRMLNRRPDKKREARAGLAGVVKASKKAANQASRAKRRKTALPPAASL